MNLAQQHILDHYHHPSNQGTLVAPTHSATAKNTTCGDVIHIDLSITDDTISEIAFSGEGCAISQAAASMLTEELLDKPTETLKNMDKDAIVELIELDLSPNRLKCALLALETAQKALNNPS